MAVQVALRECQRLPQGQGQRLPALATTRSEEVTVRMAMRRVVPHDRSPGPAHPGLQLEHEARHSTLGRHVTVSNPNTVTKRENEVDPPHPRIISLRRVPARRRRVLTRIAKTINPKFLAGVGEPRQDD